MNPPLIYDTGDDINRLHAIMNPPHDTPIHLTTSIYPLPRELVKLQNIIYLHVKKGKSDENPLNIISLLLNLETLILERLIPSGRIPASFYNLINLKHLTIRNTWFSDSDMLEQIAKLSKLETLDIVGGLTFDAALPETIGKLKSLKRLIVRDTNSYLEGASKLKVPETIWQLTNLRELRIGPSYEGKLNSERIVDLIELEVFEFLIELGVVPDDFWQLPNLREVYIRASEQTSLPSLADTKLISLVLDMHKLSVLPMLPLTLEKLGLQIGADVELPSFENTIFRELSLRGALSVIPKLPSTLETMYVDYVTATELPDLPNLKTLKINSCYHLKTLPQLPSSLENLVIGFCRHITDLPNGLHLKFLWLKHCDGITQLPSGLVVDTLMIDFCGNLHTLPNDLVVLSKIELTGMSIDSMPVFPNTVQVLLFEDY